MITHMNHAHNQPLNFDVLRVTNCFIIQKCVVQTLSAEFSNYKCAVLDGVMLDKEGISSPLPTSTTVNVCPDCHHSLSKDKVPQFALANNLYYGSLPAQFCDMTWVEEMVCALYRNIVHITHLYQSSYPAQLFVFHGNTCAHETCSILQTISPRVT